MIVFYLHAGYPDEVIATMKIPVVVRCCIAGVFGPCAVPMFYTISGYLFFYGVKDIRKVYYKIKKRIKTLIIPFIIAAIFFPLFFMMMEFVPGATEHINSESFIKKFSELTFSKIIVSLLYDSGNGMPWAYHLWFMRDLIIIVALSPMLFYIKKWANYWSIVVILGMYFLFPHISFLYGMYWFVAGSFVLNNLGKLPKRVTLLLFGGFLLIAIYRVFSSYDTGIYLRVFEISLGVSSLWSIYDILITDRFRLISSPLLNTACKFTFFLYLYHEPGFHIIVKGIPLILGDNWFGYTMSFLLSPIIMALIGIGIGFVIKKFFPAFYGILVGGR